MQSKMIKHNKDLFGIPQRPDDALWIEICDQIPRLRSG